MANEKDLTVRSNDRLLKHQIAEKFFAAVVENARKKKLLSVEHFTVDGTLIEAWASMKSFRPNHMAGVGKVIDVELGGKLSKLGGEPVKGKAYVKSISDGRYTIVSHGRRNEVRCGAAVGLLTEGVDVAVISGHMQAFDASQMKMLGFDPKDYRIVDVKSQAHFRAWWTDVASEIIDSDPPGIASNDLSTFVFKKKKRKVFPLDKDAVYPETAAYVTV